jgi:aminopeptidase YwaD
MTELWSDFAALCDCGGRFAGTDSERRALDWLVARGAAITGRPAEIWPVPYDGWRADACELSVVGSRAPLRCHPLVRSAPTPTGGTAATVIDLGRGTEADFAARAKELRDRIVLVRHEYMFAAGHVHRRRKYDWACAHGAAGFLIAGPLPGRAVAGSSGRGTGAGIPAMGIAPDAVPKLVGQIARMRLTTSERPATTETVIFDLPGQTDEWVVLSAHLDGHDLAESAIDNASGVAVALDVARRIAPEVAGFRRGLRLCFFSVEEWALTGSRAYVEGLKPAARDSIVLNVNLDSVGGSATLTALTSGFAGLDRLLGLIAPELPTYRPLMTNSDHANFAAAGVPALRLVAGFDEPASQLRHVLTPADTRDKVTAQELETAARLAARIVAAACNARDDEIRALRATE